MTVDWGEIGGTLSDQTDLQAELDDKLEFSGTNYDILTWKDGSVVGSSTRTKSLTVPQFFNNHVGFTVGTRLKFGIEPGTSVSTNFTYFMSGVLDTWSEDTGAAAIETRLYLRDYPDLQNPQRYALLAVAEPRGSSPVAIENGTSDSIQAAHLVVQTHGSSHFESAVGVQGAVDNEGNGSHMTRGIGGDFRTLNHAINSYTEKGHAIRAGVYNWEEGTYHDNASFLTTALRLLEDGEIKQKLIGIDFGELDTWVETSDQRPLILAV